MMTNVICPGCEMLARALPTVEGKDARWQLLAAMCERLLAAEGYEGLGLSDLALVVGEPSLLPPALRGATATVLCGGKRREIALAFEGTPAHETLLEPAPTGFVRVIAAVRELPPWAGKGPVWGVTSFVHDLPDVLPVSRTFVNQKAAVTRVDPRAPALPNFTAPGGRA